MEWNTWVAATQNLVVLETWCQGEETVAITPKFISRPGDYTLEDMLTVMFLKVHSTIKVRSSVVICLCMGPPVEHFLKPSRQAWEQLPLYKNLFCRAMGA